MNKIKGDDDNIVDLLRRIVLGLSSAAWSQQMDENEYVAHVLKKFHGKFATLPVHSQEQVLSALQEVCGIVKEAQKEVLAKRD